MELILNLYKYFGETPLECMERFRSAHQQYSGLPMTYAGRLDPLAEGVLLVLAGDKTKEKNSFLNFPKTYRVQALLGVSTDSYDVLGIPTRVEREVSVVELESLQKIIEDFKLITEMEYPPFSSRTVDGTPLFVLAKEGRLPEVLPTRSVEIFESRMNSITTLSRDDVFEKLDKALCVKGDFRQEEIKNAWEDKKSEIPENFICVDFSVSCGSGVYMRSLSVLLGEKLGVPALAFSIVRESVGERTIADSVR